MFRDAFGDLNHTKFAMETRMWQNNCSTCAYKNDNPVWILNKVTFSHAAAANYVIVRVLGLHDLNLFFL